MGGHVLGPVGPIGRATAWPRRRFPGDRYGPAPLTVTVVGSIASTPCNAHSSASAARRGPPCFLARRTFFRRVRVVGPVGDDFGEADSSARSRASTRDIEHVEAARPSSVAAGTGEQELPRDARDRLNVFETVDPSVPAVQGPPSLSSRHPPELQSTPSQCEHAASSRGRGPLDQTPRRARRCDLRGRLLDLTTEVELFTGQREVVTGGGRSWSRSEAMVVSSAIRRVARPEDYRSGCPPSGRLVAIRPGPATLRRRLRGCISANGGETTPRSFAWDGLRDRAAPTTSGVRTERVGGSAATRSWRG